MRAYWRHLAKTIELVLPSAHRSPQSKRQVAWLSRFCTAHGRTSLYFTMGAPFPKIAFPIGGSGPDLICDSSGPFEPTTQTTSRSVQSFLHRWPYVSLTSQWDDPSPQNLPLLMGIWTPSNTWFPGPTRVLDPNGISIDSAGFAAMTY